MEIYQQLKARFRRVGLLDDVGGILDWDRAVTMPEGSGPARAEQLAEIALMRHELTADPELPARIEAAEAALGDGIDEWDRANLARMARAHAHAAAVPADLVAAESKAASTTELAWRQARAEKNFADLAPHLTELLGLVREVGAAKGAALGLDPYDALLDQYEPGGRMEKIAPLFEALSAFLPEFIGRVMERQRNAPAPIMPTGPFPVAAQRALGERLMARIGFDFERGRLDESHHPFCGGALGDHRITTRYDEADFTTGLLATIHETGHALYEMGRPAAHADQPVGQAAGMALHESQSLALEMQAARGRAFMQYAAPLMREAFKGETGDPAWSAENLFRLMTRVAPGFIRVDADEATYPAHIILRTRLERAMIAGDLEIADLPGAWNEAMDELLGLTPPDDALGCLQDIHWPTGSFGYFPTYTMGAIAAAQLFAAAREALPDLDEALGRGEFGPLIGWMGTWVHALGSREDTDGVLTRATGRALDVAPFIGHLKARYG